MKAFLKFDASIWFILTVVASASRSVKRSGAKYSLLCGKLYSVLPTPMDIRSGASLNGSWSTLELQTIDFTWPSLNHRTTLC